MFNTNPVQIQNDVKGSLSVPLVLIHDGGGTVFHYFWLGRLHRNVYGIHNPHFNDDSAWPVGINEMAQDYAKLIKNTVREGPIILGGWSLGGLLSLAIWHILAEDANIQVIGMLMIDTSLPMRSDLKDEIRQCSRISLPYFGPNTKPETKRKVLHSFEQSRKMIRNWHVPLPLSTPPSTVLFRARKSLPEEDLERDIDGMLGWSQYSCPIIKGVFDVSGDHFTIFEDQNCESLTTLIDMACKDFEDEYLRSI